MTDKRRKLPAPTTGTAPTKPADKRRKLPAPTTAVVPTNVPTSREKVAAPEASALEKLFSGMFNEAADPAALAGGGASASPYETTLPTLPGANAALAALADEGTVGFLPHMIAGQRTLPAAGMALPMGVASAVTTMLGYDNPQYDAVRKGFDDARAASPTGNVIGSLGGAVLPGVGMAKGLTTAAKTTPWLARLMGNAFGRAGLAAGEGALQEGTKSALRGDNPLPSALIGGLAGGAGQAVLGDLVPNVARSLKDSDYAAKTLGFLKQVASKAKTGAITADDLVAEAAAAGKNAVLADTPALKTALPSLLHRGEASAELDPLKSLLLGRVGEAPASAGATDLLTQLQGTAQDALVQPNFMRSNVFDPAIINYPNPSTSAQMRSNVEAVQSALVPKYDAVLSGSTTLTPTKDVIKWFTRSFAPDGVSALKTLDREFYEAMQSALTKRGAALDARAVRAVLSELRDTAYTMSKDASRGAKALFRGRVLGASHAIEANTLDTLPGYPELNATYKEALDAENAYNIGRSVLKYSPDEVSVLHDTLSKVPPKVFGHVYDGMSDAIMATLGPKAKSLALGKRGMGEASKLLKDTVQDALRVMMPDADSATLIEAADTLSKQMATAKAGLSANAAKAVGDEQRAASSKMLDKAITTGFLSRLFTSARAVRPVQPSSAAFLGAVNREIAAHELGPRASKLANDLLMSQGSAMQNAANAIISGTGVNAPETMFDVLTRYMGPARTGGISGLTSSLAGDMLSALQGERR